MNLSPAVIRLTDPSVEPITLDQAKAHLRFTGSSSDDEIGAMISAARARVEAFCNRPFVSASFAILHDGALPSGDLPIRVPVAGVTEVQDVSYRDVDGVSQTFEAYIHDAERQIIEPDDAWPAGDRLRIQVTAGDDSSPPEVPADIRYAILLYLADMFELREAQVVGMTLAANPAAENLMMPHRERMGL